MYKQVIKTASLNCVPLWCGFHTNLFRRVSVWN